MKKHHVDVLISENDVHARIAELGAQLQNFIEKQIDSLVVVGFYVVPLCLWRISFVR